MQREYKDFTFEQYKSFVCTSYTGGASWLRSKADQGFFVVACTPVEILSYFKKHPKSTVRGQFIPDTVNTEAFMISDLNRFCMICGERESAHAGFDDRCPHPRRAEPGQPMYLDTKFEPYVLKGRKQFPPAHFGQRARLAAEPESDMERDRR